MPVLEITEADLIYHAEHMADKAFVSLLFARLAATTDGVTINGMGGGKTIFFRGVDGYLHIPKDSSVCGIPAGDHFVEFSAKKDDATGKFNGDFNSRVEKIDAARRKVCSFVAVQLGQWPDIVSWLEGKKGEGEFREVFAFSAVELAQQINKHPSVLVWALGKLGIDAKGLYDAELWFRKVWPARFPKEVPTQEWFCGGYEEEATGLTKWLMNPPSGELRKLASEARVLSLGFVTHIVEQLREKGEIENRIIYAEQSGATTVDWCSSDRIVMITELSESDTLVKEAIQSGANVLCLCDRSEQGIDHELPVRGSGKLEAVFESAGLNGSEPFDNASLIRQGFAHALKSRFAYRPPQRSWYSGRSIAINRFALLGGLNFQYQFDKDIEKDHFDGHLDPHLSDAIYGENPIVAKDSGVYRLRNIEDALDLCRLGIDDNQLQSFEMVVHAAFDATKRRPPREPFATDYKGASPQLLSGLARTLCYLCVHGGKINCNGVANGEDKAHQILAELLRQNKDEAGVRTLCEYLPLFGEAHPSGTIAWIREQWANNGPAFFSSDEDQRNPFGDTRLMTYIMWALERIAWNPEYTVESAILLAEMNRLEHADERVRPNPTSALSGILSTWNPQTMLAEPQRKHLIGKVSETLGEYAWPLLRQLLPTDHMVQSPGSEPQFRREGNDYRERLTRQEQFEYSMAVWVAALDEAGKNFQHALDLLEYAVRYAPGDGISKLLEVIANLDFAKLTACDLATLRAGLLTVVAEYRTFPSANWSALSSHFESISRLAEKVQVEDVIEKHRELFKPHPRFFGRPTRIREWSKELIERRKAAAIEILEDSSLTKIVESLYTFDEWVGYAYYLGAMVRPEQALRLLELMINVEDERVLTTTKSYLGGLVERPEFHSLKGKPIPEVPAWVWGVQMCFSDGESRAELVEAASTEAQASFWHLMSRESMAPTTEPPYQWYAQGLVAHGYAMQALHMLWLSRPDVATPESSVVVFETLVAAIVEVQSDPEKTWHLSSYNTQDAIEYVLSANVIPDSEVAKLEEVLAKVFDYGYSFPATSRVVAREPEKLLDLAYKIYKLDDGAEKSGNQGADFGQYYEILSSISALPGQDGDDIDREVLLAFASSLFGLANQRKQTKAARITFGHWIGRCNLVGQDGHWPHEAVRLLIEAYPDEYFVGEIEVGRHNARGAYGVPREDPGAAHTPLRDAAQKGALAMKVQYPVTASLLSRMARSFDRDAQQERRFADLHD